MDFVRANVLSLPELHDTLCQLRDDMERAEAEAHERIEAVKPEHRESARNLVHYVALRQHDLRPLQASLSAYGLSSLGRMESMVRSWVRTLIETVAALLEHRPRHEIWGPLDIGDQLLLRNTANVLGDVHGGVARDTRIMVTMPSAAADDAELVRRMGAAGMDLARVNCAHDDEAAWSRMISFVRALPSEVRVAMDLGGPKLRTGPLEPGAQVVRVKPTRNARGEVVRRSQTLFVVDAAADAPLEPEVPEGFDAVIPLTGPVAQLQVGDKLRYQDARGRKRELNVEQVDVDGFVATCDRTIYFETGGELAAGTAAVFSVGALPEVRQHILVRAGDELRLQRDMSPQPANTERVHRIGCSLEAAFTDAEPGEHVLFDDGKIAGVVREVTGDEIVVDIQRAGVDGVKLRAEKGINFPDTTLRIPALTDVDRVHLPFVAKHADMVNLSFVRSPEDVADLISELERLDAQSIAITLKIETSPAFRALPQMLLEAMRWGDCAVMIARGDLAVELGFDRLAEVQEEILWICEAAHVPVIWATQVLDSLARTGLPSRAEVTDAAMSRRAEAVMLNKGPFIVDAIQALTSILERMGGHVDKKRSLMRPLESFALESPPQLN